MNALKKVWYVFLALILVGLVGVIFVNYYSFLFSRRVVGVIDSVERIEPNIALMQSETGRVSPQFFSFSIGIRQKDGEIVTASSEDRQWAAARPGLCAEALYFRYPPWQVMKGNTYFNARLDRLWECAQ